MTPAAAPRLDDNPFPGLRSFTPDEFEVFFGREQQIADLVRRLNEAPLIAVAGTSGSGKSSLVLAGLLRALAARREVGAPIEWRPVIMRPGNDPIANLAGALVVALGPGADAHADADRVASLGGRLRLGAAGLAEAARAARLPADVRLLVVVDQFEELFRYQRMSDAEEGVAFVKLLIEAANGADVPVSVVLTMRSEALGQCANFRDLAEAVSRGQFLVPRMTREQRKQAIVGPVQQRGFEIAPRLVQRLLNDVSDDFDDLPVMQHVLASTWRHWATTCGGSRPIDIDDYDAVGTARHALSKHADEAFDSLAGHAPLIERIFKALTEREGGPGSEVRHPLRFDGAPRPTMTSSAPRGGMSEVAEPHSLMGAPGPTMTSSAPRRGMSEVAEPHSLMGAPGPTMTSSSPRGGMSEVAEPRSVMGAPGPTSTSSAPRGGVSEVAEPRSLMNLCAVVAAAPADVAAVVDRYRRADTVFLLPPPGVPLNADAVVDVSHESLIRGWTRLTVWAEEEAQSAQSYRRLADASALYASGSGELLGDRALQFALEWREREKPNAAWAARYAPHFERVMAFLDASHQARETRLAAARQARQRRRRVNAAAVIGSLAVAIVMSVQWWYSAKARDAAVKASADAEDAKDQLAKTNADVLSQAESRKLALQSNDLLTAGQLAPALLVGAASLHIQPNAEESQEVMRKALVDAPLRMLAGHADQITGLAFAPGGKALASLSKDGRAMLWDAAEGRLIAQVRAADLGPRTTDDPRTDDPRLGFDRSGALFVSANQSGAVTRRDGAGVVQALPLQAPPGGSAVQALAADAGLFASTDLNGDVLRWDIRTGRKLPTLHAPGQDIISIALSADGRHLAVAYPNRLVRLWDLGVSPPTSRVLTGHTDAVTLVAFSPDGKTLASASDDRTVVLWDAWRGTRLRRLVGHGERLSQMAFSADGSLLASGDVDGAGIVWQLATGTPGWRIPKSDRGGITSLAISPDSRTVASGHVDGSVALFDISTPNVDVKGHVLKAHSGQIDRLAFSDDGERLASAGRDKTVALWDVSGDSARHGVFMPSLGPITAIAFDPAGTRLALATESSTVLIWNVARGVLDPTELQADDDILASVAFSPDGKRVAAASDGDVNGLANVRIWDIDSGQPIDTIQRQHHGRIGALAFGADPRTLASASRDGAAILWNLADGSSRQLPSLHHVASLAFDPRARRLATGGWEEGKVNSVILWNLDTGQPALPKIDVGANTVRAVAYTPDGKTLIVAGSGSKDADSIRFFDADTGAPDGPALAQKGATRLAIDPTGRLLAAGDEDGAIHLWNLRTRTPIGQPFLSHDGAVFGLGFRPDGRTLASIGQDRKLVLWDAEVERWFERACGIVDPGVDTEGWPASARAVMAPGKACTP